ncbi:MAG: DNA-processing protein DprA [Chitinophagaceae bacterium]|nr:DNA-processing protein DprA [Chitinophagaceae bacterium]
MNQELFYQIALTMVPQIGNVYARSLVEKFGSASGVFKAKAKQLGLIEGMGKVRIDSILKFDFKEVENEIRFIEKHHIQPLFFNDPAYPQKLLHCYDSPVLLFYKGTADLNTRRIMGIVGTRNQSEYGKNMCENFIEGLREMEEIIIVSGLAFGVDTIAHKNSLKNGLKTVGVLAHGLDRIYPVENKAMAKEMIQNGGLLTEFRSGTIPDKMNFPNRNRIVAGMCDCIIVVESGKKGGSLITAEIANGYNRDVFAFPGRVGDIKSEGCNYLIKTNKAALVTSAEDVLQNMGWSEKKKITRKVQRELFIDLAEDERMIVKILTDHGPIHLDELYLQTELNGSVVAKALLTLEMQGIIKVLPGRLYELS